MTDRSSIASPGRRGFQYRGHPPPARDYRFYGNERTSRSSGGAAGGSAARAGIAAQSARHSVTAIWRILTPV